MEIINAKIINSRIIIERGCLTVLLTLQLEHGQQGFGAYNLSNNNNMSIFICRVMEICDVNDFTYIKEKPIRCKIQNGLIEEIGSYIKDDWFNPSKELK